MSDPDLESRQRSEVIRQAKSIKRDIDDWSAGIDLMIKDSDDQKPARVAELAERIQHKVLWGLANLSLDRLTRECRRYAATVGGKSDPLTHGSE